jgi:hypothetical protein
MVTTTLIKANRAMSAGTLDVYGYDPTILARYARYLAISQGKDPGHVDFAPPIARPSRLFDALRGEVFLFTRGGAPGVMWAESTMPRFAWVHRYQVMNTPGELYAALGADDFMPRERVLLESEPKPAPDPGGADGTVKVLSSSPEAVEIEATTPAAAILLMTDAYAPGWRVESMSGAAQGTYEIVPADLALRGIPLAAGTHRLRIAYTAPGFTLGAWVSGVSVAVAGTLLVVCSRRATPLL